MEKYIYFEIFSDKNSTGETWYNTKTDGFVRHANGQVTEYSVGAYTPVELRQVTKEVWFPGKTIGEVKIYE